VEILIFTLIIIFIIICLLSIAFLTLLEQKLLGSRQIRKGPFYLGFIGLFQPFADAVKLFRNDYLIYNRIKFIFINIRSVSILFLSLCLYIFCPRFLFFLNLEKGLLFFIVILTIRRIPVLLIR